ncbi:DUF2314 domain-containing protein [Sphingomonas sp. LB-2]|uniref:DUF2314 domain-containing protein n=1 Tax=Sphingomonas caeni TaxID=2984949 RepID=UPI002231459C|nr:DUF2314 domain-containing protein [Sphingomonas caeni]MCW3847218.1 DUF2314 domain-containing protein [Sphingomonas caeni]
MRLALTLAALAALLAPATAQAQKNGKAPNGEERVIYVAESDPAMNAAIAEGRRTLPDFFRHLANPAPGEHGFLIKFDLLPEPGGAEFIWAEVISHSSGVTIARLANIPVDPRFKLGEKVNVSDADIVDWGYYSGGVMQGNFTTRAMLPRYSRDEAEQVRRAFNW